MKRNFITRSGIALLVALIVLTISYNVTKSQIHEEKVSKIEDTKITLNALEVEMHEMANSLIIAQDDEIWGTREVNTGNVKKILKEATYLNQNTESKQLLVIAARWSQHDFSCIVDDHNVIWNMLCGNIGKATKSNEIAIREAVDRLEEGK